MYICISKMEKELPIHYVEYTQSAKVKPRGRGAGRLRDSQPRMNPHQHHQQGPNDRIDQIYSSIQVTPKLPDGMVDPEKFLDYTAKIQLSDKVDTADRMYRYINKNINQGAQAQSKEVPLVDIPYNPLYVLPETPHVMSEKRQKIHDILHSEHHPFFTLSICLIDIAVYIYGMTQSIEINSDLMGGNPWQLGGMSPHIAIIIGAKYTPLIFEQYEIWRLFTAMFIHISIPHIAYVLVVQFKICLTLEKSYGTIYVSAIYITSGFMGNLLSSICALDTVQSGGSGAISGFFGFLVVDIVRNWKNIKRPYINLVILIIAVVCTIAIGFLPSVDNFSHIGGGITGILWGLIVIIIDKLYNNRCKKDQSPAEIVSPAYILPDV